MSDERLWEAVDDYVCAHLVDADEALDAALRNSEAADLPTIAVSPPQGKLLYLTALSIGARRILEIGMLGGYSTIWLARSLPAGGRLVGLELEDKHARVARANLERAGLGDRVEIRVGPALETLPALIAEAGDPFDLVFIDADKEGIPAYFQAALQLTRSGAVIVTDNVIRDGEILDPDSPDTRVHGVRAFHDMLRTCTEVESITIQTVGVKGYDGFNLAVVK